MNDDEKTLADHLFDVFKLVEKQGKIIAELQAERLVQVRMIRALVAAQADTAVVKRAWQQAASGVIVHTQMAKAMASAAVVDESAFHALIEDALAGWNDWLNQIPAQGLS